VAPPGNQAETEKTNLILTTIGASGLLELLLSVNSAGVGFVCSSLLISADLQAGVNPASTLIICTVPHREKRFF
jgi:hypothetical protein